MAKNNLTASKGRSNLSNATDLYDAISAGFLLLAARGMHNTPSRDEIGQRSLLLTEDLKAEKLTDPDAVTRVLDTVGRTLEDWPSTALIISMLKPKKDDRPHAQMYLEAPTRKQNDYDYQNSKGPETMAKIKKMLRHKQVAERAEAEKRVQQRKAEVAKLRQAHGFPPAEETLAARKEGAV